ncbi:MAG: hypothetical protein IKR74_02050 [Bacilli bacterium]|nr:hypothetical protein [Bacilli bacterium]
MKVKYLKLSKEERKKIKQEYLATKKGTTITNNLKIARICALLCICYSAYLFINNIIREVSIPDIVTAVGVLSFGIFSIIYAHKIFIKSINDYLIGKKS